MLLHVLSWYMLSVQEKYTENGLFLQVNIASAQRAWSGLGIKMGFGQKVWKHVELSQGGMHIFVLMGRFRYTEIILCWGLKQRKKEGKKERKKNTPWNLKGCAFSTGLNMLHNFQCSSVLAPLAPAIIGSFRVHYILSVQENMPHVADLSCSRNYWQCSFLFKQEIL